jgi:hypothetical protein
MELWEQVDKMNTMLPYFGKMVELVDEKDGLFKFSEIPRKLHPLYPMPSLVGLPSNEQYPKSLELKLKKELDAEPLKDKS